MAKRRTLEIPRSVIDQALALAIEKVQTSQELAHSPEFIERFPYLLRKGREEAGLSIRALARRVGTDPTYLSRLERKLAPPPAFPTLFNIVAALPGSELARVVEHTGAGRFRHSVLQMIGDLQKLIVSVPATIFSDKAWVGMVEAQLQKCLMLVRASQNVRPKK